MPTKHEAYIDDDGDLVLDLLELDDWQRKVYDNRKRFTVIVAGRRMGKSTLTQKIVIERMLGVHDTQDRVMGKKILITFPNSGYMDPYWKALTNVFRVFEELNPENCVINETKKTIDFLETGAHLKMVSMEAGDTVRGSEWDLYIGDECAFVDKLEQLWDRAIRPVLFNTGGEAIFISTFNGLNYFHQLYNLGQDPDNQEWASFKYNIYDSNLYTIEQIENERKSVSNATWQIEWMCNPEVSTDNPFEDNIYKNIMPKLSNKPARAYGVDVATMVDWTVIIGLDDDMNMCHYERFKSGDWDVVDERIKQLPTKTTLVMDSTGPGKPSYDRARKYRTVIGFNFGETSKRKLVERLMQAVRTGEVKYTRDVADEMTVFGATKTNNGWSYKAKGTAHDDQVFALALAVHGHDMAGRVGNYTILRGG